MTKRASANAKTDSFKPTSATIEGPRKRVGKTSARDKPSSNRAEQSTAKEHPNTAGVSNLSSRLSSPGRWLNYLCVDRSPDDRGVNTRAISGPRKGTRRRRGSKMSAAALHREPHQAVDHGDGTELLTGRRKVKNKKSTRPDLTTAAYAMAGTAMLCIGATLAFSSRGAHLGGFAGGDIGDAGGGGGAGAGLGAAETPHHLRDKPTASRAEAKLANTAAAAKRARKLSEKRERELARRPELKTRGGQLAFARYTLLAEYPHDHEAFTQGLSYEGGFLYESTGLFKGKSSVRKVDPETGEVLQKVNLDPQYFGEGMTILDNEIHSLTWRSSVGFTWDLETFEKKKEFNFTTKTSQGWGITTDGTSLIVSDGSSFLFFWDPETMQETRRIEVIKEDGRSLPRLNELEMIKGYIFANVWFDNHLYKIDPTNGMVVDTYNFGELYPAPLKKQELRSKEACLNGIAWDPVEDVLYLTGKLWPRMYKVKLSEEPAPNDEAEQDGGGRKR